MVYLTTTPIAWDRIAGRERSMAQRGCGSVVTFVGVVRRDEDGRRAVQALFYDAYPEMAERLIQRLVDEANARWSLEGVQVQHRLGFVEVGHISVVVVVAAQHRAQAYAASQFLIERIKHNVPIWKREHYDDGASQWIRNGAELLRRKPMGWLGRPGQQGLPLACGSRHRLRAPARRAALDEHARSPQISAGTVPARMFDVPLTA